MYRVLVTIFLVVSQGLVFANVNDDLQQSMDSAKQQRQDLGARIEKIQKNIDNQLKQRKTADVALKKTESTISDLIRQLNNLEDNYKKANNGLLELKNQQKEAGLQLKNHQQQLSRQMHAQYKSQLSAWSVLLSGDDPNEIGRNLAYIGYIHKHQAKIMDEISASIEKNKDLQSRADVKQNELQGLIKDISKNKQDLEKQKEEHAQVLKNIDKELKIQRSETKVLEEDQQRLGELIQNIQVDIDVESKKKLLEQNKKQSEDKQKKNITAPSAKLMSAPAGAMLGLEKNLIRPVEGEILGRFGANRPEGGVWRGVVIRSPQDTKVKAVAPGQVVYANWLAGFGNILIIDHGSQFLSVYAYNHSLLKQIGDKVAAKDIIATVGATGGQVEPGLYFEIREGGKPINPVLWLIQ